MYIRGIPATRIRRVITLRLGICRSAGYLRRVVVARREDGAAAPRAAHTRGQVEAVASQIRLITIHHIHSQSHMHIHDDSSPCSLLGVYP